VSNHGETVKLADFGLATSSDRSEDYGCGSTFYMSPECLDHSSRRPFYYCAPNDVWSLGVILVNLTCGRNPWKQASLEDSTYRAYTKSQDFLKTILPLSDELNDILGRIFTRNPDQRITLPELRARILACSRFTEQQTPALLATPPASPEHTQAYVDCEDAIDDELDYDSPFYFSPGSPDSMSDGESTCSSDDGSLSSSSSSPDDLEDDDLLYEDEDRPEARTPSPKPQLDEPAIFEPEDPRIVYPAEYCHPYSAPVPEPLQPMPIRVQQQPVCTPKYHFQNVWDSMLKYAQPAPPLHHPVPFHHQVAPFYGFLQNCY
jgi:serine/threonine protein kinase